MGIWDTKNASRRLSGLERRFDSKQEEFLWKLFCPIRHSLDNYTNAWPLYKNLNDDNDFVSGFLESKIKLWSEEFPIGVTDKDVYRMVIEHQGGKNKSPALSHATLGDIEHYNWGCAVGLKYITDGLDEMGRSLFHASCLPGSNADPRVIVQILKDKEKAPKWIAEKNQAIHDFFAHAFTKNLDVSNAKAAVDLLEKNQPEAFEKEYTKTQPNSSTKIVYSVRIGLWYKLFYANQFTNESAQISFLEDWLKEWDSKKTWLPTEKIFLLDDWEKVPPHFQKVMMGSKARLEKDLLTQKCAPQKKSELRFGETL